jgi:hypothetical protein
MDLAARASLVRAYRTELKQARQRRPPRTHDEQIAYERSLRGFRAGERLRQRVEAPEPDARPLSFRRLRRANVRIRSRTGSSSANGVLRNLRPYERVNAIGVASRRRRVSPGLAPGGANQRKVPLRRRYGQWAD